MRESLYLFPVVETLHVFGIVSLVSSAFLLDLRLFGVGPLRDEPVDKLARWVLPWVIAGFTVQVVTGVLMFSAEATRSSINSFFWYKMFMILGVGINALVFHTTVYRQVGKWNNAAVAPLGANLRHIFDHAVARHHHSGAVVLVPPHLNNRAVEFFGGAARC